MRRLAYIALAAAVALAATATGSGSTPPDDKEQRRAARDSMAREAHSEALAAIDDSAFVIEADRVTFKRGYMASVTPNTNFVAVCGQWAVVQVAFDVPWPGFNGLGGITVDGRIVKYRKSTDRRGNTIIDIGVSGHALSAQVSVTLWRNSNEATARISQNLRSGRITLDGRLVPTARSSVYGAMPL